MKNISKISKKIEKKYKIPINNTYSHRFYRDLFTGYAYSLGEKKLDRRDFFVIVPDNREIVKIFTTYYDFSYDLERTIDNALYSMAVYGKAYIFVRPEYVEKIGEDGKINNVLEKLYIREAKGILKKDIFYYKTYSKEISSFDISEGMLITLDLKEVGFKRNYFIKLVKRLGKYDITSAPIELINNEPTYDFSVHVNKNREKFLRANQINNDDRDDGQHNARHHRSHLNLSVTSTEILDQHRNSLIALNIQYQRRQEVIIPYPHGLQNSYRNHGRLQNRKHDQEEGLDRIAAVNHGCLFNFQRNRFHESRKHENCKSCTKSQIDDPDIPRRIELQPVCRLGKGKHNHLEGYNHGKYKQEVKSLRDHTLHSRDIPGTHGAANENCHNGCKGNQKAVSKAL